MILHHNKVNWGEQWGSMLFILFLHYAYIWGFTKTGKYKFLTVILFFLHLKYVFISRLYLSTLRACHMCFICMCVYKFEDKVKPLNKFSLYLNHFPQQIVERWFRNSAKEVERWLKNAATQNRLSGSSLI